MAGISGVTGAGPIFHHTMLALHENKDPTFPTQPSGLVSITTDPRTGHRSISQQSSPFLTTELCPAQKLPQVITPNDYSADGRAYLSSIYEEWLNSEDHKDTQRFALRPPEANPALAQLPRIISPLNQSTYYLDPELPTKSHHLSLLSNLPSHSTWSSPTLTITENKARLTPGTHLITLTHQLSGEMTSHQITVENL